MKNIPLYIVIHCTDVSYKVQRDQFSSVNEYHRQEGFPISSLGFYVGYHVLLTGAAAYKCRADTDEGAHCNQEYDGRTIYPANSNYARSMNFQSIGICVGFDGDIELMPQPELDLLQAYIFAYQAKYNIPNDHVFFHRDFRKDKTCPGSLITKAWLSALLTRPQPPVVTPPTPTIRCTDPAVKEEEQKVSLIVRIINSFKKK